MSGELEILLAYHFLIVKNIASGPRREGHAGRDPWLLSDDAFLKIAFDASSEMLLKVTVSDVG